MRKLLWIAGIGFSLFCTGCATVSEKDSSEVYEDSINEEASKEAYEEQLRLEEEAKEAAKEAAQDFMQNLGAGWNLGNALDAYSTVKEYELDTETLFGNPVTTEDLIDTIRAGGFTTIRVPVTYENHMDENNTIDPEWLERVNEVVEYVLQDDMYCIIDIHHDTGSDGWLKADIDTLEENKEKLAVIWTQIGEYFNHYDDHLLFEGYNEILNSENQWSYAGEESYEAANELNQTFVDTIRSLGGNNETRYLLVNTYAASGDDEVLSHFALPTDTQYSHLIVGVHSYIGTDGLEGLFERINQYFTSEGTPVILGEFGLSNSEPMVERTDYVKTITTYAQQHDIGYIWWDDGNYNTSTVLSDVCGYALLNRNILEWTYPEIVEALVNEDDSSMTE